MGKWLTQFKEKNVPETPNRGTAITAIGQKIDGNDIQLRQGPATLYQAVSDKLAATCLAGTREYIEANRPELAQEIDQAEAPPNDSQPLATGTPDGISALGAACREQIRKKGYCLVRSAILGGAVLGGEVIAVVDSDTRRNLAPAGYVTYTLRELELLAEGYQAGHIVTIGDLRLLHEAKKKLAGVIVR